MDNKTSLVILERVKAAREKAAAAEPAAAALRQDVMDNPGLAVAGTVGAGLHGAAKGLGIGALMGLGYGAAKGRPVVGTARGAGRGALTLGGVGAGGVAGLLGGLALGADPLTAVGTGLGGAALGGVGGWKAADRLMGEEMREKEKEARDPSGEAFAGAVQNMAAGQLRGEALKDIGNVGLTALGVGAAGRGLIGLIQTLRENRKKTRSGPTYLPLPYPAEPKQAGFLDGDMATSKSGIPWYGPAMLLGGLGGLGAGWHGMDKVLDARRQREQKSELEAARQQFHDALLGQYDEPVKVHPGMMGKKSADQTMVKVGQALDALFHAFEAARAAPEKHASIDVSNLAGQGLGGYGMYAGLTGLLSGAFVYDKIQKRSRRAVLEKALQKRQRRKFMQQPTEIYAVPEPMAAE